MDRRVVSFRSLQWSILTKNDLTKKENIYKTINSHSSKDSKRIWKISRSRQGITIFGCILVSARSKDFQVLCSLTLCCIVYVYMCTQSLQLCLTLCDPWTEACQALLSWDSPGKNSGVDCHSILQGIIPNPGIKPTFPASSGLKVEFSSEPLRKSIHLYMKKHIQVKDCEHSKEPGQMIIYYVSPECLLPWWFRW